MSSSTMPVADPLAPSPGRFERILARIARLGVIRSDGWIGGVSAGVAARLRIDPILVRGVFVIATLFGLPLIFLYAIAWALLPDADGRVQLRELGHARFDVSQLGILVAAAIGLFPVVPVAFLIGTGFGAALPLLVLLAVVAVPLFLFGLALVCVLLVLLVRAAGRTAGVSAPEPPTAWADPATSHPSDDGSGAVADADGSDAGADASGASPASVPLTTAETAEATAPADPAAAVPGAGPTDLDAWRAQHEAWREQDQAWRRQQQDAERAAREQLRQEQRAATAHFAAEAAERRRIRRASNPRAKAAYVAAVAGLALVVGAVVALIVEPAVKIVLGLLVATLVLAFGMVIAGVMRRRSGFLAFLTALVLAGGGVAAVPATFGDILFPGYGISNVAAADHRQLFGGTTIQLDPLADGTVHPVSLEKNSGSTYVEVGPGVRLDLTATGSDLTVNWQRMALHADGSTEFVDQGEWTGTRNADGTQRFVAQVESSPYPDAEDQTATDAPVTIDQRTGTVYVTYYEYTEEDAR